MIKRIIGVLAGLSLMFAPWVVITGMVLHDAAPSQIPGPPGLLAAMPPDLAKLPAYDSLQEAAVHAIARDYECSHYYECAGVIAQRPDGKYVVGPVRSDDSGDSVHPPHSVPTGWKLVAEHHTHPCLPQSHEVPYFSPDDLQGYISLKTIGIMGDLCSGEVHLFNPASDNPSAVELPGNPGVFATKGHIIGQIAVDGKDLEPNEGI